MSSQPAKSPTDRRPFAVWLALWILVLYIPFWVLINFLPSESVLDNVDMADDVVGIAEFAVVVISLAVAIGALAMRKQWGRWFVAAPTAYFVGTLLWGHFVFVDEGPDYKMGILLAASIGLSPLVIVVLLVSFGEGVKNYFAERRQDISDEQISGGLPR